MNQTLMRRAVIAFEQRMRASVRITGRGGIVPMPLGNVARNLSVTYPFAPPSGINPKRKHNARKPA